MIKQGRNVIIDSTCNYNEVLDQGTALARQYGYDYRDVECRVDDVGLLDRRLHNRAPLRSQRTGLICPPPDTSDASDSEDYRALFKTWIQNLCRPAGDAIIVDSTGSPEGCLDYKLKQIVPPAGVQTKQSCNPEIPLSRRGIRWMLKSLHCDVSLRKSPSPRSSGRRSSTSAKKPRTANFPIQATAIQRAFPAGSVLRQEGSPGPEQATSNLQRSVTKFLGLDAGTTSVIYVTSGTNALRAALKAVIADGRSEARNEIIVPSIIAVSTAETVMMEGFVPVLVNVDPRMLSPEATARAISERTAAIVTVDWPGTLCDLRPFRKLADEHSAKLVSVNA
ncbi:MAG: hypothetical protein Q9217_002149 [Psora testacea]